MWKSSDDRIVTRRAEKPGVPKNIYSLRVLNLYYIDIYSYNLFAIILYLFLYKGLTCS
jgi:hypothetical protein